MHERESYPNFELIFLKKKKKMNFPSNSFFILNFSLYTFNVCLDKYLPLCIHQDARDELILRFEIRAR